MLMSFGVESRSALSFVLSLDDDGIVYGLSPDQGRGPSTSFKAGQQGQPNRYALLVVTSKEELSMTYPALKKKILGLVLGCTLILATVVTAAPIPGETGASSRWGSGWLDLNQPINFNGGDRLRLTIGGTATNVKVRLLSRGQSPDTTAGILPGIASIPDSRIIEVEVPSARSHVIQISVHGGSNPWGRYPLGGDNGPATLESAEIIRP